MSLKKPRSDSKLAALDVDQQRQLCEWLLTPGLSYEAVKKLVLEAFKVSTVASALSRFYQEYVSAYLIQRRAQAVGLANELHSDMEKTPGKFDQATIDALSQKAFEFAQNPMVDPRDVKHLFSLVLKARDQDLKEKDISIKLRRLELLETQASETRKTLSDHKLTPMEQAKRVREIFKK